MKHIFISIFAATTLVVVVALAPFGGRNLEAMQNSTNSRDIFNLAQSHQSAGRLEDALSAYQKHVEMGGPDEDVFWSLLQIGLLKEALGMPPQDVINAYKQAYAFQPNRVEPLFYLAHYQRKQHDFDAAYKLASHGLKLKSNDNVAHNWIQDYGLLFEYALSAYQQGQYTEALMASKLLLSNPSLPGNIRESVHANLAQTERKLAEIASSHSGTRNNGQNAHQNENSADRKDFLYALSLAQSYKSAGDLEKALGQYKKLAHLKGSKQEIYWALLEIAILEEALNKPSHVVIEAYHTAYEYDPNRVEAPFKLISYLRKQQNYEDSFVVANQTVTVKPVNADLANKWIYDYGLLLEYALAAYKTNRFLESYLASNLLLSQANILPVETREFVENNLATITTKLHRSSDSDTDDLLKISSSLQPIAYAEHSLRSEERFSPFKREELAEMRADLKNSSPSNKNEFKDSRESGLFASDRQANRQDNPINFPPQGSPNSSFSFGETPRNFENSQRHFEMNGYANESQFGHPSFFAAANGQEQGGFEGRQNGNGGAENGEYFGQQFNPEEESYCENTPPYDSPYSQFPQPFYPSGPQMGYFNEAFDGYSPYGRLPVEGELYSLNTFGKGIGHVDSYQTIGTFIRFPTGSFEPLLDLRVLNFCRDRWGANIGAGFRYHSHCTQTVYGINAFYDYRSSRGNFNQAGVGVEFFGKYFDFFANGYIPSGSSKRIGSKETFIFPGGYFATSTRKVKALRGFDFEFGTSSSQWFCPSPINLYLGVGGYYYAARKNFSSSFSGVRYRAELSFYDLIYAGICGTSDKSFHSKVQGYFAINLSFNECGIFFGNRDRCCSPCSCLSNDRLNRPIQRYPVIVESDPRCCWKTNF